MEELLELKSLLLQGDISGALVIDGASLEVAEGIYDTATLETMVNRETIIEQAFTLISPTTNN